MGELDSSKKACVVFGMHRSGTSALSSLMACFGADHGRTLMSAKPENPKGFWENQKVVELNDRILDTLGGRWDLPPLDNRSEHETFLQDEFHECICATIQDEFNDHELIALKDPRFAFTYPLWNAALAVQGYKTKPVLIVRNPIEVFQSINARNGFSKRHSDTLWLETLRETLSTVKGGLFVIQHDYFFNQRLNVIEGLTEYLGMNSSCVSTVLDQFETKLFDPQLRHFSASFESPKNSSALQAYEMMISETGGFRCLTEGAVEELYSRVCAIYTTKMADDEKLALYLTAIESGDGGRDPSRRETGRVNSASARLLTLLEQVRGPDILADPSSNDVSHQSAFMLSGVQAPSLSVKHRQNLEDRVEMLASELETVREHARLRELESERRHQKRIKDYIKLSKERNGLVDELEQVEHQYHRLEAHFYSIDSLRRSLSEWRDEYLARTSELAGQLRYSADMLWKTKRWRIGDSIVNQVNRILGRQDACESHRVIDSLVKDFEAHAGILRSVDATDTENTELGLEEQDDSQLPEKKVKLEYSSASIAELDEFLDRDSSLDFRYCGEPDITVILVLFNRAELTYRCLRSLIENRGELKLQLVVIDNDSKDRTSQLLGRIHGAVIRTNSKNLGFLRACNHAVEFAEAKQILFLNNDAEVVGKSMQKAHELLCSRPDVGAVGAKILALDGCLQEAGSSCWRDASCFGYGRGEADHLFKFEFEREVDFCSGAFLQTRLSLWKQLGGFDEIFAPAYYEDADYCLSVNQAGYKVLYHPEVIIRHYEFGSSEGSNYAVELSVRNQSKFLGKHANLLARHFEPDAENIERARFSPSWNIPRILYIDDRVPHCFFGAGFPRSNFILNHLAGEGYRLSMLPLNFPDEEVASTLYADIDRRVEVLDKIGRANFEKYWSDNHSEYDLVWVSRPHNMDFVAQIINVKDRKYKIVYDAEAIFADREKALRELGIDEYGLKFDYDSLVKAELNSARVADALVAVSLRDKQVMQRFLDESVQLVNCGYGLKPRKGNLTHSERSNLLFVGNLDRNETPNVDSLLWFVDLVWPKVKSAFPDLKLNVVGSNLASILQVIQDDSIVFHGKVDELSAFYDSSLVFIAPTRYAAGLPLKVQEAAANGLPCVVTSLLAEQLLWSDRNEVLVADVGDANKFAQNCIELLLDQGLWSRLQDQAYDAIESDCNPKEFRQELNKLLNTLLEA